MALASAAVSVGTVPSRAAWRWLAPGSTISTLEPRARNCDWISSLPPWPRLTMVVTEAMPMTTPSTVRPLRILFLASVRRARKTRSSSLMGRAREEIALGGVQDSRSGAACQGGSGRPSLAGAPRGRYRELHRPLLERPMRTSLGALPVLLALSAAPSALADENKAPPAIRVMSYNVRYGTARDGDNHWDK